MALTAVEKITINMGPVDLGQIDLLVREGYYQNRTDFIRTLSETRSENMPRRPSRRWSAKS